MLAPLPSLLNLWLNLNADVSVSKDGQKVTGNSILGLMMLAAAMDDAIEVSVSGADEIVAIKAITELIENKFGENLI